MGLTIDFYCNMVLTMLRYSQVKRDGKHQSPLGQAVKSLLSLDRLENISNDRAFVKNCIPPMCARIELSLKRQRYQKSDSSRYTGMLGNSWGAPSSTLVMMVTLTCPLLAIVIKIRIV